MADNRVLIDAFNSYYNHGLDTLESGNYELARDNFLLAAEALLKLAKDTTNKQLKERRIQRADELTELANSLTEKKKMASIDDDDVEVIDEKADFNITSNEGCTLEEAMAELNSQIGLESVKVQMTDFVNLIKANQMKKNSGMPVPDMSYHLVFSGNPGTGKTTVARIVAKIYRALGLLSKGQLVEANRSKLVGQYIGHTEAKTNAAIDAAMGGILFIDEAQQLVKKNATNDFGTDVINCIVTAMENHRDNFAVIVAGYEKGIKEFIESDEGLASRFKTIIHFDDYDGDDLLNIFKLFLVKNRLLLDASAEAALVNYFDYVGEDGLKGNGRAVRNMFEDCILKQSKRLTSMDVKGITPSKMELSTIYYEDLPDEVLEFEKEHLASKEYAYDASKDNNPSSPIGEITPEDAFMRDHVDTSFTGEYRFQWDNLPTTTFDDIAGLESVKEAVKTKVILPLKHPNLFEGYSKKNGGGLFLYGPPGTGKTMIGAAIANEIGAKFCSVKPSDLIHQGAGNTEKAVKALFGQARSFPCAIIYFDEIDALAQKNTKSSYYSALRSELLAQMQGLDSYGKDDGKILLLIGATNKPWNVDSAFVRPGRLGTRVYVGIPDDEARRYIIERRFDKINSSNLVKISDNIDLNDLVDRTIGYNGSDITNLLDEACDFSAKRALITGEKVLTMEDFEKAFEIVHTSVQKDDLEKLLAWRLDNDSH